MTQHTITIKTKRHRSKTSYPDADVEMDGTAHANPSCNGIPDVQAMLRVTACLKSWRVKHTVSVNGTVLAPDDIESLSEYAQEGATEEQLQEYLRITLMTQGLLVPLSEGYGGLVDAIAVKTGLSRVQRTQRPYNAIAEFIA